MKEKSKKLTANSSNLRSKRNKLKTLITLWLASDAMEPKSIRRAFHAENVTEQARSRVLPSRTCKRLSKKRSSHTLLRLSKDLWLTIWTKNKLIKLFKSIQELPVMVAKSHQYKVSDTSAVSAQTSTSARSVRLRSNTLTPSSKSEKLIKNLLSLESFLMLQFLTAISRRRMVRRNFCSVQDLLRKTLVIDSRLHLSKPSRKNGLSETTVTKTGLKIPYSSKPTVTTWKLNHLSLLRLSSQDKKSPSH